MLQLSPTNVVARLSMSSVILSLYFEIFSPQKCLFLAIVRELHFRTWTLIGQDILKCAAQSIVK